MFSFVAAKNDQYSNLEMAERKSPIRNMLQNDIKLIGLMNFLRVKKLFIQVSTLIYIEYIIIIP